MIEKAVVVRRKTRLEELIARFNTKAQAKFYIEHAGGDFADYEREDDRYHCGLEEVAASLRGVVRVQVIDRTFLPNFLVAENEVIVTVGQDGLVANTAKYVRGAPIVAVNPDPERFDGVLLPFRAADVVKAVDAVGRGRSRMQRVTMAEAKLADGQRLLAFNDFFVGANSHVSARYRLTYGRRAEEQSSSGVLVSTGAGSTGWLSSVFNMTGRKRPAMPWDTDALYFIVREPFVSRSSSAQLIAGKVGNGRALEIESHMPRGGVIFSDGVEADYLEFNSGATVHLGVAPEVANIVVG